MLNTEGRLFLFGHAMRPVFFLTTSQGLFEAINHTIGGLNVYVLRAWEPIRGPVLHEKLHRRLANQCRNRPNLKIRRNGNDSAFSQSIRTNESGCFDTPFIDVDALEISEKHVSAVYELKWEEEREDTFQTRLLANLEKSIPVIKTMRTL